MAFLWDSCRAVVGFLCNNQETTVYPIALFPFGLSDYPVYMLRHS